MPVHSHPRSSSAPIIPDVARPSVPPGNVSPSITNPPEWLEYDNLFRMKADAAKSDVFYLISGKWRTSVERFFQWIGGSCPSELLNFLTSQLEPLTDQQLADVCNLRQSSQQAEDALPQGIDKLQQTLS
ncbi:hypothetical protein SADUNF_Sadunf19G0055700 [Salix dunnii]|uniref:DOG1 domain-containing protein n=1 Tax=Salix dunnii TaxID=1413687 RepID=A0A835J404_9ROSI|nr:hypothetical protein SADUNF_Sadunf19G0055700 [Salix dunnii]